MNEDTLKGQWNQLKGKAREKWGKLTNDDLNVIQGQTEQLVGLIQQRYGMARDEAWSLIEELAEHATQDRFVYYHRWRVGDVLMWDERATMHRGAGDYRPEEHRIMLRTIVYPN